MKHYSRICVARLKRLGMQSRPDVCSVHHLHPRAYCVAKPAIQMAILAVPTPDREPQVRDEPWTVVQNESAGTVNAGDWCAVAYIVYGEGSGDPRILEVYKE